MSRRSIDKTPAGFTLVEMLVVITIISLLMALLVPAVQAAREAGRRTQCQNNLKQLGLAFHNHNNARQGFPATRTTSPAGRGWCVDLLPFIEQSHVHKNYDFTLHYYDPANQPVVLLPLPIFQCTSTPNRGRTVQLTAGNGGVYIEPAIYGAAGDYYTHHMTITKSDGATGSPALAAFNSLTPVAAIVDGLSNTMLVNEMAGRPELYIRGIAQAGQVVSQPGWAAWAGYQSMPLRAYTEDGREYGFARVVNATNSSGIYSFHPDGANSLFADGAVHFLSESVAVDVVLSLATRNGSEMVAFP